MTFYEGTSFAKEPGSEEILARCVADSYTPVVVDDETCRLCGQKHIKLCYTIRDPVTGLVISPIGSECICVFTHITREEFKAGARKERNAEKARLRAEIARKVEERRRAQHAPLSHQTCMSCRHTFCKFYHDPTSAHADRFCWKSC